MKRRKARENAFIALFEFSFGNDLNEVIANARIDAPEYAVDEFGNDLLQKYMANVSTVEDAIQSRLKGWTISRLPKVNTAILRLAVTEILYGEQGMDSVVINEAVELAKSYGEEGDYQFINGVLGSLSKQHNATPNVEEDAKETTSPVEE